MTIPPNLIPTSGLPLEQSYAARKPVVTGLCARGECGFCQGRVYNGHDGHRSVYVPCECDCRIEAQAA